MEKKQKKEGELESDIKNKEKQKTILSHKL